MKLSGEKVLRLLLINYGFCHEIEITGYTAPCGNAGYDVSAKNNDGKVYKLEIVEDLFYHMYHIQKWMMENNIRPRELKGLYRTSQLLDNNRLDTILSLQVNQRYCKSDYKDRNRYMHKVVEIFTKWHNLYGFKKWISGKFQGFNF